MASSSSLNYSKSNSNISKSRSTIDYAHPCYCEKPSQVWTSTTTNNPGRKFRVCRNSLDKKKKKCDFWEWVDQNDELIKEDNTEVEISILENNFWTHKKVWLTKSLVLELIYWLLLNTGMELVIPEMEWIYWLLLNIDSSHKIGINGS
ncbi:unnamed protein product [Lactuca saligna]|uniref:GRF-type domain-containing protein n=1 Tax=Lactuca saligna TaxID=75948 RepID=A0AA35VDG1_LACSI|nr:unnamed protein product [Lactuca saligna]